MSKQEQAEKDYLSGMKYKDIAEKYDVSINTVKSWKNRYGWQRGRKGAPPKKSMHTKTEKGAYKNEESNDKLTPKQELFCQLVGAKRMPLYQAYKIAYNQTTQSDNALMVASSRLHSKPEIKERIVNIQQEVATRHKWSLDKVINSLTFVHDAAETDIYLQGLKKANSDAMMNSLDRISNLLHISDEGKRAMAEADVAKIKADEMQGKGEENPILVAMAKQAKGLIPEESEEKNE